MFSSFHFISPRYLILNTNLLYLNSVYVKVFVSYNSINKVDDVITISLNIHLKAKLCLLK